MPKRLRTLCSVFLLSIAAVVGMVYLLWRMLGSRAEEVMTLEDPQEFVVAVDHHQFYVEDAQLQVDTSALWNERAFGDRLDTLPGLVAVGTARYGGSIRVTIELAATRPADLSFDEWDHVVECSLAVQSGDMVLSSPAGPGRQRFKVPPGMYRVLVLYGGLDTVVSDYKGDDHYYIILWPDTAVSPQVLKRKPR